MRSFFYKTKNLFSACGFIVLIVMIPGACKKNDANASVPKIETIDAGQVDYMTAVSGGKSIQSSAGILAKGVCWSSTNNTPTIADPKTSDGSGLAGYASNLSGLSPLTTYYVRAYATNKYGTGYGDAKIFTTAKMQAIPVVVTDNIGYISVTSVSCGGYVVNTSDVDADSVGLCWSTHSSPTKNDHVLLQQSDAFITNITGLTPNTNYYIRAFATSSKGTGYGNQFIVKTYKGTVVDADGNVYFTVQLGSQEWMAQNVMSEHFKNGIAVAQQSYPTWNNTTQPAYTDSNNPFDGGYFYNWYAGAYIAPAGWHVATSADWQTLINFMGVDSVAYKLILANYTTSNQSNFMPIASGYVDNVHNYYDLSTTYYWLGDATPTYVKISGTAVQVVTSSNSSPKNYGYGVRCVKD